MSVLRSAAHSARQRGFGLVEIMVGLVIGLIAVLVIYQVYNVAEGFKRNTTAAGEAQMAGLFSTFVLGMETANGGAAMALSAPDLGSCADTGNIATSFRPIPVLITDGGAAGTPDSFVVTYSMATTLASPAMFNFDANADDPYQVQSPGGFHVGDLIVAVAKPGSVGSDCPTSVVTAVGAPALRVPPPLINDVPTEVADVTITHTGTGSAALLKGDGRPGLSTLFNMGPCAKVQRVRYDVSNNVLRATPLLDTNGANCGQPANPVVPNPLASNIVNMKVEYGIDSVADPVGLLDTWVQATNGAIGDWTPATMLAAPITQINQVKAIRIGIIVQSEQFDKELAGFTGGDYVNGAYNWVLFDCPAHDATCPGRLTGSIAASVSPPGNWRFRKYETIIPLRNEIWNKQ